MTLLEGDAVSRKVDLAAPKPDEEEKPIFTAKELSNAWYRQVREKYGPVTEYHRLNFGQLK